MDTEILDATTGELVPVEPSQQTQIALFGTTDSKGIIAKAQAIADVLVPIVEKRKLYKEINGRKHVYVEGWTNMLAMIGVFPHVISTTKLDREDEIAYHAKVELRTLNGQTVGIGEAICSSRERNWSSRDEYAVLSMAQTRATGKASRLSFSWLLGLAGYDGTPAEEIPNEGFPQVQLPKTKPVASEPPRPIASAPSIEAEHPAVEKAQKALGGFATEKQRKMLFAKCRSAGVTEDELKAYLWEKFKIESTKDLRWQDIDTVVKWIDAYVPQDA